MPDLSNAIWQGIGVVVGAVLSILSLIVSVILFKRAQSKKLLIWDIQHISTLSMFEKPEKLNIVALFDNQPIADVSLFELKIWNAGNAPITATDYERPLRFIFQAGAKILDVDLVNMSPKDIAEKKEDLVWFTADTIQLNPQIALNQNTSLTLRVLLTPNLVLDAVTQTGKIIGGQIQSQVNTELSGIGYLTSVRWGCRMFLMPLLTLLAGLPILLVMAGAGAAIYFLFGERTLEKAFIYFLFTIVPLGIWLASYATVLDKLREKNISYQPLILFLAVGILPLSFLVLCLYTLITSLP